MAIIPCYAGGASEFIDGHQVPPQPSLVKAEQVQVPQSLIVGSALQSPDHALSLIHI